MAERESMRGHPSGCDPAGSEGTLDLYLKLAEECMGSVGKMPPRKFNNEQCDYLAHKLEVVLKSASSFLKELGSAEDARSRSSADMARWVLIFKLLLALAKEIKSFTQSCCKDAWIQAAMTLTNVSEYVSSVGFKLELCRIALCAATGSLTVDQVDVINKAEVELVKKKASMDADNLLEKVILELNILRGEMRDLANYLLERMEGIKPIPANSHLSLSESDIGDGSCFRKLYRRVFEKVQQTTLLGRGASASVHKATWLGTQVAKKTFMGRENPHFMKEANILGGLCHPNITSMFCCAKDKKTCSIIMELMDEDLHDFMHNLVHARCDAESNNPPFFILEAVGIMLQVGEGVKYLHDQKIVHGDLKSMNILVRSVQARELEIGYVHAKVADFGLSKTKECSTRFSNPTFNTGSTRWMPPEVINLDNLTSQVSISKDSMPKYPFKRDVFSFGMVCYELLTGNEPFSDEPDLKNVKKKVLKGERPDLPDHCPKELKTLIRRCWSQVPTERPSFVEICQELKHLNFLLLRGLNHGPHRTIEEPLQLETEGLQQISSTSQQHLEPANNMHLQGPNMLHYQIAEQRQVGTSEVRISEGSSHGANGHVSAGVEIAGASIDPSDASVAGKEKVARSKGVSNSRKNGEKSVQSRVDQNSGYTMENIMDYRHELVQPSVVFFQETVQVKRLYLRRFVAALIEYDKHRCDSELEQNGYSLRDVVHRLFPHAKFAKERHFKYGIEAWVSCKAFKEFGKSEEMGPPDRRRQIESMEEYRKLTIVIEAVKAVTPEGEDYIRSFHLFCSKQYGHILNKLKWKEEWPDHLVKDFLEAMKHVWRAHKLALAFEPAAFQFRAKSSAQFDVKFMEPLELPTVLQTDTLSPFTRQVGFLVNPGFIVLDRLIKCQVYLAPDASLV
ncbi:hypothetical protein M758_3G084400 [Ceratodon purpureus]|uniref:Protein kinase domain-containing protein n=1 Tax=Ceratodon purpureus TaxID=3225 RepID=A0A8T0IIM8_CERPU|nr:hypothetical protein KC19_3G082800 [Ceratodon purpureus]KAG0582751.1 hypothetical protein KC19_3G082800 [Ceratodon purpureus]KAG0622256.1 hypothetical protein M758_3G084400 [Ceratodon purpureus]